MFLFFFYLAIREITCAVRIKTHKYLLKSKKKNNTKYNKILVNETELTQLGEFGETQTHTLAKNYY